MNAFVESFKQINKKLPNFPQNGKREIGCVFHSAASTQKDKTVTLWLHATNIKHCFTS